MVSINLKLGNKTFYTLLAIAFILIVAGVVIAYNSSPAIPAVMGHSLNEIAMPACSSGQALAKQDDGSWGCGAVSGSLGTTTIITSGQSAGGTIQNINCPAGYVLTNITQKCGTDYCYIYSVTCARLS